MIIAEVNFGEFGEGWARLGAVVGTACALAGICVSIYLVWTKLPRDTQVKIDQFAGLRVARYLGMVHHLRVDEQAERGQEPPPITFSNDIMVSVGADLSSYAKAVAAVWMSMALVALEIQYRTGLSEKGLLLPIAAVLAFPIFLLERNPSLQSANWPVPIWIRIQMLCAGGVLGLWIYTSYPTFDPALPRFFFLLGSGLVAVSLAHPGLVGTVNSGGRLIGGPGMFFFSIGLLATADLAEPLSVVARVCLLVSTLWLTRVAVRDVLATA